MDLIDILIVCSYLALNFDVLLQNIRVYQMHDSADISLTGVSLRLFAVTILAIKFNFLDETDLLIGQSLLTLNVTIYLLLVFRYRIRKRRARRKRK